MGKIHECYVMIIGLRHTTICSLSVNIHEVVYLFYIEKLSSFGRE